MGETERRSTLVGRGPKLGYKISESWKHDLASGATRSGMGRARRDEIWVARDGARACSRAPCHGDTVIRPRGVLDAYIH